MKLSAHLCIDIYISAHLCIDIYIYICTDDGQNKKALRDIINIF